MTAIGGAAAFKAIQSIRAGGRLEIAEQHIGGDVELLSARPAKLSYRVTIPGIGQIANGYDGRTGWALSLLTGPEVFSGRQLSEAADDAWFDAPLHLPDHVRQMTTLARADFDGRTAYKIRVAFTPGNEQTEYFDTETGFQTGEESERATPQGIVPTVNILRNYRKFGALQQPTTLVQRALGFEQVITIATCEYNTVPDTAFALPAEVKALVRP